MKLICGDEKVAARLLEIHNLTAQDIIEAALIEIDAEELDDVHENNALVTEEPIVSGDALAASAMSPKVTEEVKPQEDKPSEEGTEEAKHAEETAPDVVATCESAEADNESTPSVAPGNGPVSSVGYKFKIILINSCSLNNQN